MKSRLAHLLSLSQLHLSLLGLSLLSLSLLCRCDGEARRRAGGGEGAGIAAARKLLHEVVVRAGGLEALRAVRTIRKSGYVDAPNLQLHVTTLVRFPDHARRAVIDQNPTRQNGMTYALVSARDRAAVVSCVGTSDYCGKVNERDKGHIRASHEELVLLEPPKLLVYASAKTTPLRPAAGVKLKANQLAFDVKLETGTWATLVLDTRRRVLVEVRRAIATGEAGRRVQLIQFDKWQLFDAVLYPTQVFVDPAAAIPPDADPPSYHTFVYQQVAFNLPLTAEQVVGDLPAKAKGLPYPPRLIKLLDFRQNNER